MTPKSHHRVFGIVSILAFVMGGVGGPLIGMHYSGATAWLVGVIAGLIPGILTYVLFMRLIRVRCPECNSRMLCRMLGDAEASFISYFCANCGTDESPDVAFGRRLLDSLFRPSDKNTHGR